MIKRLTTWHLRPDRARHDALAYLHIRHAALVASVPGVRGYVQNHCAAGPAGAGAPPYDGLGEVWFDSPEAAQAAIATPEWRAVLDDATGLMDMGRVTSAWDEEHEPDQTT
jgi:uncharacterized protein (TIGR02118 family)